MLWMYPHLEIPYLMLRVKHEYGEARGHVFEEGISNLQEWYDHLWLVVRRKKSSKKSHILSLLKKMAKGERSLQVLVANRTKQTRQKETKKRSNSQKQSKIRNKNLSPHDDFRSQFAMQQSKEQHPWYALGEMVLTTENHVPTVFVLKIVSPGIRFQRATLMHTQGNLAFQITASIANRVLFEQEVAFVPPLSFR